MVLRTPALRSGIRALRHGVIPVSLHNAQKLSYSRGAYIRFGGNYDTVGGVAVLWQGRPN
jgi:hypothetical protein